MAFAGTGRRWCSLRTCCIYLICLHIQLLFERYRFLKSYISPTIHSTVMTQMYQQKFPHIGTSPPLQCLLSTLGANCLLPMQKENSGVRSFQLADNCKRPVGPQSGQEALNWCELLLIFRVAK